LEFVERLPCRCRTALGVPSGTLAVRELLPNVDPAIRLGDAQVCCVCVGGNEFTAGDASLLDPGDYVASGSTDTYYGDVWFGHPHDCCDFFGFYEVHSFVTYFHLTIVKLEFSR
jgi:hypothetical protein